jgi:hypothetical protein
MTARAPDDDDDDLTAPPRARLVHSDVRDGAGYHVVDVTTRVALYLGAPGAFTGLVGMSLPDDGEDRWLGYVAQAPDGRLSPELRLGAVAPRAHDLALGYSHEDDPAQARAFREALVAALNAALFEGPAADADGARAAVCAGVAAALSSLADQADARGASAVDVADLRRLAGEQRLAAEAAAHTGRGPHAGDA